MLHFYPSKNHQLLTKKRILTLTLLVFSFIVNAQNYCNPTWEYNADGNMITSVIFGDISKTSPFQSGTTPTYEDFTSSSTEVELGQVYPISVKGPSSTFPSDVVVFIDFNQNGSFDDSGESFFIGRLAAANPANALTITENITIPANAVLGTTRMRILKNTNIAAYSNPNADNSIVSSCGSYRSGQTEDYTIIIKGEIIVEEPIEVNITTENNNSTTLTSVNQTLQLIATITPTESNQNVNWTIESGDNYVSINNAGLVTAQLNGTAIIRATSVEDSTAFDEILITVNASTLGIKTNETNSFQFENPIGDNLIVHSKSILKVATINIIDLTGKTILSKNLTTTTSTLSIDTSKLPKGVYQLIIKTEQELFSEKLIKK